MEPSFTIKATAQMTSLNAHSIRAWERRYSALTPSRHENGRRLYSQEDVSRLKLLAGLVSRGHSISSIAALSSEILSTMTEEKTSGRISPDSAGPWPHEFGLDKMSPSQSAQDIKDSQYHRTPILNHSYQTRTDKRPPADSVSQLVLQQRTSSLY
ncbi:MAG: MerR family transcriptional regulator [Proteobacteria bacterium]|nr:MerR family transcriptional regulator [Pseudomonadota bacterium]